jgi:hypothetical protein
MNARKLVFSEHAGGLPGKKKRKKQAMSSYVSFLPVVQFEPHCFPGRS